MAITQLVDDAFERQNPRPANPEIAILGSWRTELAGFFTLIKAFRNTDLVEILMNIAAMSGRASEIRNQVMEGSGSQRMNAFRTKQLDPFLDEVDRQFRVWSRVQAVRTMEWDMSKGGM